MGTAAFPGDQLYSGHGHLLDRGIAQHNCCMWTGSAMALLPLEERVPVGTAGLRDASSA